MLLVSLDSSHLREPSAGDGLTNYPVQAASRDVRFVLAGKTEGPGKGSRPSETPMPRTCRPGFSYAGIRPAG